MNAVFKSALVAVTALSATSALAADGTGTATVELVDNITITQATGLDFGYVLVGRSDTVVVSSDNVTVTGAGYLNNAAAGTWNVTGTSGKVADIGLPASTFIYLDGDVSSDSLQVSAFETNLTDDEITLLGTATNAPFNLGATLTLDVDAPVGVYTGSYTVTANYQ